MSHSRTSGPSAPRRTLVVGLVVAVLVSLLASAPAGAVEPPSLPVEAPARDELPVALPVDLVPAEEEVESTAQTSRQLVGTFALDAGDCAGPSGTYFQMAQPGGDPTSGPFVQNNDSPCDDKSVTPLRPGSDGGLVTGSHQPHPQPAFRGNNGAADRITEPQPFFGTDFAAATSPTDPQTGTAVPAPSISADGDGGLTGDLRSFGAAWQTQHFNQGSPKPDGSTGDGTAPITGTYDEATGRFVIEWTSRIQGGAFNNFTGVWHLEGTFRPGVTASGATAGGEQPTDTSTAGPTGLDAVAQTATPDLSSSGSGTSAATSGLADTGGGSLRPGAVLALVMAAALLAARRRSVA